MNTPMQDALYRELRPLYGRIPKNTYKSIVGQIRKGDYAGAQRGMNRIKEGLRYGTSV